MKTHKPFRKNRSTTIVLISAIQSIDPSKGLKTLQEIDTADIDTVTAILNTCTLNLTPSQNPLVARVAANKHQNILIYIDLIKSNLDVITTMEADGVYKKKHMSDILAATRRTRNAVLCKIKATQRQMDNLSFNIYRVNTKFVGHNG